MFLSESQWVGTLIVTEPPREPFTLTSNGLSHDLGFAGAPAFFLDQPPSPDDAWEVGPIENGRIIRSAASPGSSGWDEELAAWLPEGHRGAAMTLARSLPCGEYTWLRSHLDLAPPGEVLLGNAWSDGGPAIRELWRSQRFYAAVVGSSRERAPDIHQPLLGIVVLNYDGTETMQGILFFPCMEPSAREAEDRLLVIPRRGPLVLDNLGRFSAEASARCQQRWAEEDSAILANELIPAPAVAGKTDRGE